jgi:hypothetical protein
VNGLDCDRALDAGAWVLHALPDDEATGFVMHLRGCPYCRAEVARLQTVADVLPVAAEQIEPPAELRARVMDVVREEAARAGHAVPARRRRWTPRLVAAIGAAGLAVGVGIGAVVLQGDSGPGPVRTYAISGATGTLVAQGDHARLHVTGLAVGVGVGAVVLQGDSGPGPVRTYAISGATGTLVAQGDHARLHVTGLAAPADGRVYQVWKKRPGADPQPTDALFTVSRNGSATVDVPGGVEGVERVLVTSEPAGGSDVPTTRPIFSATPA